MLCKQLSRINASRELAQRCSFTLLFVKFWSIRFDISHLGTIYQMTYNILIV